MNRNNLSISSLTLLAAAVCAASLVGCDNSGSSSGGKLTGSATYQGKPVPAGSIIVFMSSDGKTAAGTADAEGNFTVSYNGSNQMPPSKYKVSILPPPVTSTELIDPSKPTPKAPPAPFPAKYSSDATSGLEVTVKEGENPPFKIELE